jgi:hypothetical protein
MTFFLRSSRRKCWIVFESAAPRLIDICDSLKGCCPLWLYVLAEARHQFFTSSKKAQLGWVGGSIVAGVFLRLLQEDEGSFLYAKADDGQPWHPTLGRGSHFTLADLIRHALAYKG